MQRKIIGYKLPFDLFGGALKKEYYIYRETTSPFAVAVSSKTGNQLLNPIYNIPKEIVKQWEPVYEEPKFHVGEFGYPKDNSYAQDILTRQSPNIYLAGTSWLKPVLVRIVSAPFMEKVGSDSMYPDNEMEFVLVEYQGSVYRVLNRIEYTA